MYGVGVVVRCSPLGGVTTRSGLVLPTQAPASRFRVGGRSGSGPFRCELPSPLDSRDGLRLAQGLDRKVKAPEAAGAFTVRSVSCTRPSEPPTVAPGAIRDAEPAGKLIEGEAFEDAALGNFLEAGTAPPTPRRDLVFASVWPLPVSPSSDRVRTRERHADGHRSCDASEIVSLLVRGKSAVRPRHCYRAAGAGGGGHPRGWPPTCVVLAVQTDLDGEEAAGGDAAEEILTGLARPGEDRDQLLLAS